ncbi:WAT1-related protein At1g25270-like [Cornus florida]|uniref:WAT1-related protein At1g25270-like n=1 Tax=Cornus florida TaxID=4283 RepID=UPI00289FBF4A|nr:WAT1-related protein At1g25270-like [Cornus florida]
MAKVFPVLLMLLATIFSLIVNIFNKLTTTSGMSTSVLTAYRFIFGTMLLALLGIYKSWGIRHNLTWKRICLIFMCGLFGGPMYQNLYLESLRFTSATFATAIINLTPVVTFILAKILRLEILELRTLTRKLKTIGIILSSVGVELLTFYHHMEINIESIKFDLLSHVKHEMEENHNLVLGLGLVVIATLCNAISLILQKKIEDDTKGILLIPSLINVMGAIQATIYALCVEKDWAHWKLGWDIRLLAALFVGVCGSGVNTTIITFCVSKMDPVFVSAFSPMSLMLMVVIGSLLPNEKLYLTSLIAIVIIIITIVMLLCGKLREMPAHADANANTDAVTDADAERLEGPEFV